jgi:E3 ubiquitin-protein ligase UBR7
VQGTAEAKEDDEDEEKDVLIPSESYDGLICAACVDGHPLLKEHAGKPGWMVIEPTDTGSYEVMGRLDTAQRDTEGKEAGKAEDDMPTLGKRPAEDDLTSDGAKRARVGEETSKSLQGKRDVFLAHGIREQLESTLSVRQPVVPSNSQAEDIASLPFPLDDEEIYEPPQDDEQGGSTDMPTTDV